MGNNYSSLINLESTTGATKNFNYYFSKDRITRISRGYYPDLYEDGYLWGRIPKYKMIKWINENKSTEGTADRKEEYKDYPIERAFW